MKFKSLILFSVFTLLVLLVSCTNNSTKKEVQKPNILLINIDDMGWRDVGFMGSEYYETPNIDALAA